jgi:ABC-type multidrug transport system ATPase subunit
VTAVLALHRVTKRYTWRGPWVLSGADLVAEPGSLTSIVGTNGSGKSTLLRIAAGVSSPSGGVAQVPDRVGFVPERQAGRGTFTGAAYLEHMGRIRGLGTREAAARASELLETLGVRPGPDVRWDRLSKGNRQKVVLAQAFLARPEAVVLDEPFSGLDEDGRGALLELVAAARREGASIVLSSHDVPPGVSRSYRIVHGRLEEEASEDAGPTTLPRCRVVVVRKRATASLEGLTERAEVLRWATDAEGEELLLDVEAGGCDDLIRAALDLDWSVRSVVPLDDGAED